MMAHPTVAVPALRSFLEPLSMPRHLYHSFGIALTAIPLVSILPALTPLRIALTVFALVGPASSLLFWDVLPVTALGAIGTGTFLALRAATMAGIVAWVLEELRESRRVTHVDIVVVEEDADGVEVVAVLEADVEIADEALRQRKGVLKSHQAVDEDE
ncbi:hypothetical protein BCR35DRAFT_308475 [Leucosporidium creatinivorum]|uniref:Uncharacterized protein n=1 Tax=Leucosporidium creatinivorum TaxID=106004 RepID=A0A1Y2E5N0_9BASI|nr:hypothetical protein BCR35DRAFT_308475 [Leucosporidium creatinivorum]